MQALAKRHLPPATTDRRVVFTVPPGASDASVMARRGLRYKEK